MKEGGKYVVVGATPTLATIISLAKVFLIPTFLGGGQRSFQFLTVKVNGDHYGQIGQWMAEGKVKPVIEEVFSLEDVPKAFEKLKTGRVRGKLVIEVSKQ